MPIINGLRNIQAGGTDDHSQLSNLDYDHAGHTGFQKELTEGDNIKIEDNVISAEAPENMVDTDTEQTITGPKTFNKLDVNNDTDFNVVAAEDINMTAANGINLAANGSDLKLSTGSGLKALYNGKEISTKEYVDEKATTLNNKITTNTNNINALITETDTIRDLIDDETSRATTAEATLDSTKANKSNTVTTDTTQTVSGAKTFTGDFNITRSEATVEVTENSFNIYATNPSTIDCSAPLAVTAGAGLHLESNTDARLYAGAIVDVKSQYFTFNNKSVATQEYVSNNFISKADTEEFLFEYADGTTQTLKLPIVPTENNSSEEE